MADEPTPQERDYQRAAEIANVLLGQGLPVIRFGAQGGKLSMTFQLEAGRAAYTAFLKPEEATPERFRDFYEVVA